tara:strand:+ start:1001 stop:1336 length:336 start_codon:yes stop_codon:yes gene_type:complete
MGKQGVGKGNTNNPNGRPKGVENKVTKDTREAFKNLVEDNTDKFQGWLDEIAKTNPSKAFELLTNVAEYVLPKLSRTEITAELKVEQVDNIEKYSDEDLKRISEIREANKK